MIVEKILGHDRRLKLGIKLALSIFATWFMTVNAHLTFAQKERTRTTFASANQVIGQRSTETGNSPAPIAATQEHGLSQKAVEIARPLGLPITNSMVVSWIVALGLIIFARFATRNMKSIPGGAQNLLEWLVGGLYDFLERSSARVWSSERSGFLPQFSFSFFPPIGWDSFRGLAPSGGDIRPPTVS
jgi:hypothetical protein